MGYSRARPDWVDWPDTSTLVRAQDLDQWDQAIYDVKSGSRKYVGDYGAGVGQGTAAVDTPALQAAANDAISAGVPLELPPDLRLNDTIHLSPSSSSAQFNLDIESSGPFSQIQWTGADNTAMFRSYGWKRSRISGVHLRVPVTNTGVVGWDVDHDSTRASTGSLDWYDCEITSLGAPSTVGWRLGHSSSGSPGIELSFMRFFACGVGHDSLSGTSIGWVNEDNNGLDLYWYGCGVSFCSQGWSNLSTAGAASSQGGPTMYWYGCGGSGNSTDFHFQNAGVYGIFGGRWELGQRFLNVPAASTAAHVLVDSAVAEAYSPSDGQVFRFDKPGSLELRGCAASPQSGSFSNSMITMNTTVAAKATLRVIGGGYVADDPFYNAAGVSQPLVYVQGVKSQNLIGQTIGQYTERDPYTGQYVSGAGKTTVADADFLNPINGMQAVHYDTTGAKAYLSVRANGAWKVMAGPV